MCLLKQKVGGVQHTPDTYSPTSTPSHITTNTPHLPQLPLLHPFRYEEAKLKIWEATKWRCGREWREGTQEGLLGPVIWLAGDYVAMLNLWQFTGLLNLCWVHFSACMLCMHAILRSSFYKAPKTSSHSSPHSHCHKQTHTQAYSGLASCHHEGSSSE